MTDDVSNALGDMFSGLGQMAGAKREGLEHELAEARAENARLREEVELLRAQLAHWQAICAEASADPLPFCDDTEVDA